MAYTLSAFIARSGTFASTQALSLCITVVPLAQGFEMLLSDEFLKEAISSQTEFAQAPSQLTPLKQAQIELAQTREHVEEGFPSRLTDALVAFGLSLSQQQPIAYVEAEFFGGNGEQYAVLWQEGQVSLLPSTNGLNSSKYSDKENNGPINSILRALGVKVGKYDEFYALGLGLERGVRGWFRRINPHADTGDCEFKR